MPKFEILSVHPADPPQWTGAHGTFNAYELQLKGEDGTVFKAGVNQKPTSPPPEPGLVYGEAWQNEQGFWKFKRERAVSSRSTGQATFTQGDDIDKQMHPGLIRREAVQAAVGFAGASGEKDLAKVEGWVEYIESLVQRAAGAAQSLPPPASSPTANGDDKITPAQIQNFILRRQKQFGITDETMGLVVKSFGVERLKDLPRSRVDEFAQKMLDSVPDGTSDVPDQFQGAPAGDDGDDIPFAFPVVPTFTEAKAHENR